MTMASPPDPERERQAQRAVHLHHLVNTPEWEFYDESLRELEMRHLESLCTAAHDWRYIQGRIQGLRDARGLPGTLIKIVKGHP